MKLNELISSLDEVTITNIIGLLILLYIHRKRGGHIALIFIIFYCVYMSIDIFWLYHMDSYTLMNGNQKHEFSQTMYLLNALTTTVVMVFLFISPLHYPEKAKVSFIAAIYIFIAYVIPTLTQANLINTQFSYQSYKAYEYIMSYTVVFDIIIVLVGLTKERGSECSN